ncbi:MAG: hypothetical protein UX08_C0020G0003 [Candidatus Collierbacteria bacterium GW2011_GWB1_45_35]|uniref:Uncharacterized protein n=1 Tax=Candidatus Collierbacteria bacterium GW2011_GWB2_45_17 TaxID=1618388 RepID=A0A837IDC8_9BACT|nr:MAG: hypothetical protein UW48_C0013G0019 [Microgenomates group bacterium GW2011_GWC1_44_23]KKT95002.1 MAG: hypothetical protein UW96_C0012G0019 [Candidatus Collierbacteria bacterium GW2011_GWA1_45_15]KKT99013.1 MAG: hypothetical protein UX01_C0014G0003 [Candidatus Collierbacteria bacterium GW2011_GWB2_45_17]KKU04627.1 MAG: hypothetical protein UX08_C0020G0003 [Candidatus Collierbacteria bacterium GW2011_GWB1_45_35]KKU07286.1 MAG: hypothetical protein UX11_C0017G0003 [Candidatus Collierbacte
MSYRTLNYEVSVDRDKLLDLFLGRGNLLITLDGQTTTLQRIYDLGFLRDLDDREFYSAKIEGVSDAPNITEVDGKCTLALLNFNRDIFILNLELHLQDQYE